MVVVESLLLHQPHGRQHRGLVVVVGMVVVPAHHTTATATPTAARHGRVRVRVRALGQGRGVVMLLIVVRRDRPAPRPLQGLGPRHGLMRLPLHLQVRAAAAAAPTTAAVAVAVAEGWRGVVVVVVVVVLVEGGRRRGVVGGLVEVAAPLGELQRQELLQGAGLWTWWSGKASHRQVRAHTRVRSYVAASIHGYGDTCTHAPEARCCAGRASCPRRTGRTAARPRSAR